MEFQKANGSFYADLFLPSSLKSQEFLLQSNITRRMFGYIQHGMHPSKETILSMVITAGLEIDDIQDVLKHAGYFLSRSLPNDMVILHLLEQCPALENRFALVWEINHVLQSLDLPLLGTRFY